MNWSDPRVKTVCFNWLHTIAGNKDWTGDQLMRMAAGMVHHLQDVERDQQLEYAIECAEKTPNESGPE